MKLNLRNTFNVNLKSLLLLLASCLLAYWPLTFHLFSLKNDALNYFLPVRHQISEALYNGYFPYWSPYFNLGYPLHGDMQSGVWNPFVQLFSLFGPYTLRTLQLETLLYIYISGTAMYFLVRYLTKDSLISLLIGTAYMLCGFNSDSAQFLNWISAASFLPFVILFYLRTITEKSSVNAIYFGFFLYLLFSTAYPADFIILVYILIAIFIWNIIQEKIYTSREKLFEFFCLNLTGFSCFLILALPVILSYLESLPLTERGNGATYEDAMSNPLHFLLLFTYITPLASWKAHFASITDPLERNNFFGLITFGLLIFGLLVKSPNKFVRFCKWALLFSFLFSLGEIALIRPFTYYVLPLMDTFRHPANAKIFTIFFSCLISSFALKQSTDHLSNIKNRKITFYLLTGAFIVVLLLASTGTSIILSNRYSFDLLNQSYWKENFKSFWEGLQFFDFVLINALIQVPFLTAFYFYFVKKIDLKKLIVIGIINSIIHTALFQPFTVVKKDNASSIQQVLNSVQVAGYPLPDLTSTLASNSYNGDSLFNEIGTINMYNKKIGRVTYRISPSNLNLQNDFWFNEKLKNHLFQYPLLYKADTAIHITDSAFANYYTHKKIVLLSDSNLINKINNLSNYVPYKATVKRFTPISWDIEIESSQIGFYTIFQNFYPNWNLYVAEKTQKIYKTNISFMGFELKEGKNIISFRYEANHIKWAFYLNIFLIFLILGFGTLRLIK